jgi:hypothetical protein
MDVQTKEGQKMRLFFASALLLCGLAVAEPDPRDISSGSLIYSHGYCDQPYIVTAADGTWICVFTTSAKQEGATSQYIAVTQSRDQGTTWSEPVPIEDPHGPEASWGMPFLTDFGRLYVFYVYNGDNVRTLPDGTKMRADTHGWYCYRYSDDGGATWSERRRLPMRLTDCDRDNDFGGETQMFWGIGKPVAVGESTYFGFTKLHRYFLKNSEGWFYHSPNLQTERDIEKVTWELLPEGEKGLRHPDFGSVQEEQNLVPLANGDLYCVYRTTLGRIAESYSRDGGKTWSTPEFVRYHANGQPLKNPRACPRLWRTKDGRYLLWYHNHGGTDFADRNPAWISGGIEKDGRVVWSQPEILFHGPDNSYDTGRFSYPDLVEEDGRYWISLTQKTQATIHEVDKTLLEGLWGQFDPPKIEPAWPSRWVVPDAFSPKAEGFTIEMKLRGVRNLPAGHTFTDTRNEDGRGITLSLVENGVLRLLLSDGEQEVQWDSEPGVIKAFKSHHIAVIVDRRANLILFVIDGILCDGGPGRPIGWGRMAASLGDVEGQENSVPSNQFSMFHLFHCPMRVSEAVRHATNLPPQI